MSARAWWRTCGLKASQGKGCVGYPCFTLFIHEAVRCGGIPFLFLNEKPNAGLGSLTNGSYRTIIKSHRKSEFSLLRSGIVGFYDVALFFFDYQLGPERTVCAIRIGNLC